MFQVYHLMILMTIIICVASWFGRSFLGISSIKSLIMSDWQWLVILALVSYPLIAFINNVLAKVRIDRIPIFKNVTNRLDC